MNSGPLSRKSFWCSMIARATFSSVFRRCSIDSMSQRADWIRFWMNSRAAGSVCLVLELLLIVARDRELRRVLVDEPDLVPPCSFGSTIRSGTTYWAFSGANRAPGLGLSRRRCSIASLIFSIAMPVFFSMAGRRFCCKVVEVVARSGLEDVAAGDVRRQLQQQALAQVARADARRVELLHQRQAPPRPARAWPRRRSRGRRRAESSLEDSRCRRGCKMMYSARPRHRRARRRRSRAGRSGRRATTAAARPCFAWRRACGRPPR